MLRMAPPGLNNYRFIIYCSHVGAWKQEKYGAWEQININKLPPAAVSRQLLHSRGLFIIFGVFQFCQIFVGVFF